MRHAFVHSVINDHSRVAFAEVHDDETALTAPGVLARAVAWYSARGVTVERVLSDNGSAYKSRLWQTVCDQLGITMKKTRPRRPQTNGKIERFHRTSVTSWTTASTEPLAVAFGLTFTVTLLRANKTDTRHVSERPAPSAESIWTDRPV